MAEPRNPYNPDSELYRKLTKLLSGPIARYKQQSPTQLKRIELNKYKFNSMSGQAFRKEMYGDLVESLRIQTLMNQSRLQRYNDFNSMEFTGECASCLTIYADEITYSNTLQRMLRIDCPNTEIKEILNTLFYDILNIECNLFGWVRSLVKFGDTFLYLDVDPKLGIKGAIGLPVSEVERLEGLDKTNPTYVQYQWNTGGLTFENWQIAHFRLLANDKYNPYGVSVLDPARRIWRSYTMLQDAIISYRLVRAPERRVFYIDVGNIDPDDVEQYVQKIITSQKRHTIVDENTGTSDLRHRVQISESDYYIPIRGGNTGTKIETLPGGAYTGDVDDLKMFRDQLFTALNIPAAYLTQTENGEDKGTLAQKDIRFSRTVQRLQKQVVAEMTKIAIIHLFTLGFRGNDLLKFNLSLNNPSKIAEMQELDYWKTKIDVAEGAKNFFSTRWISSNIFGMTEEEWLRIQRERYYDAKMDAAMESAEEGGGGLTGGLFGDESGSGDMSEDSTLDDEIENVPVGGIPEVEAPEENENKPDKDSMLLTAPAKRESEKPEPGVPHITPGSKGKPYTPVMVNKHSIGARKQHNSGTYSRETSRATERNIWQGMTALKALGHGIAEGKEQDEALEKDILKTNYAVKLLLETLGETKEEVAKKIQDKKQNKKAEKENNASE